MTKEAILLHFETIFACEPIGLLYRHYSYFSNTYYLLQSLSTATPSNTHQKYQQLFRPLGGSHQAVASKLTDFSKFNVTVKSDTDIPSIDVVFLFLFYLFVLFCSFYFYFLSLVFFSFFFFLLSFLSFLSFFVSINLRTVTVYTYNQGTAFSGL